MAGPWEKYQDKTSPQAGPWLRYGAADPAGDQRLTETVQADLADPIRGRVTAFRQGFVQGGLGEFGDEAQSAIYSTSRAAPPATSEPEAVRLGRLYQATGGREGVAYPGDLPPSAADRAPPNMGTPYGRELSREAWRERPLAYGAGYAASMLGGAGTASWNAGARAVTNEGTRQLPRLGRLALQGAGGGAAAGALYGAGSAEGDAATRVEGAAYGAGIGAATGGVLGPLADVIGSGIAGAARRLPLVSSIGARNRGALGLGRALQADGVTAKEAEKLARAFNQRSGITTPAGVGSIDRQAVTRGERSGRSAATLLDLAHRNGWDNTVTFLEAAAGRQGPARRIVEGIRQLRQLQRGDRVRGRLDQLNPMMGGREARPSLEQTVDTIGEIASQNAQPLYAQLDRLPIQLNDGLERMSRTGIAQDGMRAAVAMARRGNIQDDAARAALEFIEEGPDGVFYVRDGAPASTWDMVKKGMDAVLFNDRRAPSPGQALTNYERGQAKRVYWRLVHEIDTQTGGADGAYAQARASWAGDQAAIEAAEHASKVWNVRAQGGHQSWMADAKNWGAHERFAAQVAAYDSLVDQASEGSLSAFAGSLNPKSTTYNPQRIARLREIFGDQLAEVIAGVVDEAERLPAINAVSSRTGPATARRLTGQTEFDQQMADATMEIALGSQNPLAGAISIARRILKGDGGINPKEAGEVMRLALDPYTPSGTRQVLARAALADARRRGGPPPKRSTLIALRAAAGMRQPMTAEDIQGAQ